MGNMDLWDAVSKTNPETTKKVNQRGGFTAICAQSQIKAATKQWGPFGLAWGLERSEYGYVCDNEGNPLEVWFEGTLYFVTEKGVGRVEISSDKAFKVGDDNRKKVRTDAITKALSNLGFNSDVFEGKFDDNKYVQQMKQEFAGDATPKSATALGVFESPEYQELRDKYKSINAKATKEGFESWATTVIGFDMTVLDNWTPVRIKALLEALGG